LARRTLKTLIKKPKNNPTNIEKMRISGLFGLEAPKGMAAFSKTVNTGVSFLS
jgi:hypothetical protein